jgi:hypothetical protein
MELPAVGAPFWVLQACVYFRSMPVLTFIFDLAIILNSQFSINSPSYILNSTLTPLLH